MFQAEEQVGKQAIPPKSQPAGDKFLLTGLLEGEFRQAEIASGLGTALILVSKKGK